MGESCWQRFLGASLVSLLLLAGSACGGRQPDAPPAPPEPPYTPTATIKDIMEAIVDPSADVVWEGVSTVVDAKGIHDKVPKTDEEWKTVRLGAITLLESANLLMMPGRHVARPHEKSTTPGVELEPEEIEININNDRVKWNELAKGLHTATLEALQAIDAKDGPAVTVAGELMERACENCHSAYWYPNQPLPPGYLR